MIRALFLAASLLASPALAWTPNGYDNMLAADCSTGSGCSLYEWPFTVGCDAGHNIYDVIHNVIATAGGSATPCPSPANVRLGSNITGITFDGSHTLQVVDPSLSWANYNSGTSTFGAFTTIMWLQITGSITNNQYIFGVYSTYISLSLLSANISGSTSGCDVNSTVLLPETGSETPAGTVGCGPGITDGSVHMVAWSCPGASGNCSFFIDGALIQSNVTAPTDATLYVYWGAYPCCVSWNFVGNFGNISQMNGAALTTTQVLALFHCGLTGTGAGCGSAPAGSRAPIGQIIGLRDTTPRLPAALRGAYRRIEPARLDFPRILQGNAQ